MADIRIGTYNDEGERTDLYIPRKCHASGQLIKAYDYASIQIAIADIEADGTYSGQTTTFCISGDLRTEAVSDHAINRLCITHGIIRPKTGRKTAAVKRNEAANTKEAAKKKKAPVAASTGRGRGGAGRGRGGRGASTGAPRKDGERAPRGDRPQGRGRGGRGAGRGRGAAAPAPAQ